MPTLYWHHLKSIGSSWAVRVTALAPFLGYVLLLSDEINRYLKLSEAALLVVLSKGTAAEWAKFFFSGLTDLMGPSYQLASLFFGLILLGIGAFLYRISCPRIVDNNLDDVGYLERVLPIATQQRYIVAQSRNAAHVQEWQNSPALWLHSQQTKQMLETYRARAFDLDGSTKTGPTPGWIDENAELVKETFEAEYFFGNRSKPLMRALVSALFVAGFAILAIPSAVLLASVVMAVVI